MKSTSPKQEEENWRVRMYNAEHLPESDLEKIKLQNSSIMRKKNKPGKKTAKRDKNKNKTASYKSRSNRKSKTPGPSKFFKTSGSRNKIPAPRKKSKTPEPANMKPLLKILETIRESR